MRARWQTLPEPLPADPMPLAADWLQQAWDGKVQRNPNSMSFATVGADGRPSVRVLLCKEIVVDPGYLVFYTNYDSRKGRDLQAMPWAAAVLHWDALGRQLRVEGPVLRSPPGESDAYFGSRPWRSQLAALVSAQSTPIATRQSLLDRLGVTARHHRTPDPFDTATDPPGPGPSLPRPPNWGGYRLWASAVELWVEGANRLHDRARYQRTLTPGGETRFATGPWRHERLQP